MISPRPVNFAAKWHGFVGAICHLLSALRETQPPVNLTCS
jgi:hypothetical protein